MKAFLKNNISTFVIIIAHGVLTGAFMVLLHNLFGVSK